MKKSNELKLDPKDVLKLIKACRVNGVSKFEGFGLSLVLGEETTSHPLAPTVRRIKAAEKKALDISTEALVRENGTHVEEQLDMLLLEDPGEYERLLREGELEDASKREAYDRGTEPSLQ